MAVELDGNVRLRGDTGPGVGVTILAENERLRLVSGNELVGDWLVSDIGISSLQDGFNIKAEGDEFILRTTDDVALAEELGVTAVSPRLARRLAARHNPDGPDFSAEPSQISSNLAAIGFAVAGALIVLGGSFLSFSGEEGPGSATLRIQSDFWLAFVIGGALMVAAALVISMGMRFARAIATLVLVFVVVVFALSVSQSDATTNQLTAYGFIAGGLVVGLAVLVSGSLRETD